MTHAGHNIRFTGPNNRGLQIGYNSGNIETHFHAPTGKCSVPPATSRNADSCPFDAERPETPPEPSLFIPFRRDPDFVDRRTILDELQQKYAVPGSRAALIGLGGVG